jgi:peroxiredoxin
MRGVTREALDHPVLRFCHAFASGKGGDGHANCDARRCKSARPAMTTPVALGWPAAFFDLPGIDGRRHTPDTARGPKGLLVMFLANHCPYVRAIATKIARDTDALAALGIGSIAIMSNDASTYPDDSFDNMKAFAAEYRFNFPYVVDESQEVARAYDAVCTPEFFGFDASLTLAYRGRLDASGRSSDPAARRELYEAMVQVARTGRAPLEQTPAIGCSIKWRG